MISDQPVSSCPYSQKNETNGLPLDGSPDAVAMMGPHSFERSPLRNGLRNVALPLFSELARLEHRLRPEETSDPQMPGPGGRGVSSLLYSMSSLLGGDLVALMQGLYERFGGGEKMLPVLFNFGGRPGVLLTHPKHLAMLRDTESFAYMADPDVIKRFRAALGFNLITVDHDTWKEVRPRTVAYLSGEALDEYAGVMRKVAAEDCLPFWERCARERQPMDAWASALKLSARTAIEGFLRVSPAEAPADIHLVLSRLFGHVRRQVYRRVMLPQWLPLPRDVDYETDMRLMREFMAPHIDRQKTLDTMMGSIIRGHTKPSGKPNEARLVEYIAVALRGGREGDILELDLARIRQLVCETVAKHKNEGVFGLAKELCQATIELARDAGSALKNSLRRYRMEADLASILCEGGEIDRELVLQETISNLIGATETSILLMTWALYFLGAAPRVQDKLHAEVASDREHRALHVEPSTMRSRWPYLYNVMREVLRIASPSPVSSRVAIKDVDFDGFAVKKGTPVWICQYITQRSPYVWKEPNRFVPERWDGPVDHNTFFPFSQGQRSCPGQNFAYIEAGILIGTILKHFRCKTLSREVGYDVDLTVRPSQPVMIQLEKR